MVRNAIERIIAKCAQLFVKIVEFGDDLVEKGLLHRYLKGSVSLPGKTEIPNEKSDLRRFSIKQKWLRGLDLNQRPLGYEDRINCLLSL